MNSEALLEERIELFDDTIKFKPTKRTPLVSNAWTWKYLDENQKLSEVLRDYDAMETSIINFHKRYQFDSYLEMGTRNPFKVIDPLGGGFHVIDDEKEAIAVNDHVLMERSEYKEMAENPIAFLWTRFMPRFCKDDVTVGDISESVIEFTKFIEFSTEITQKFINDFGVVMVPKVNIALPFEAIFNGLRGIKNSSLDVRKCMPELREALDAYFALLVEPTLDQSFADDYRGFIAPVVTSFLGHSILSAKQFEELYWPYLKKIIDKALEYNKPLFIFSESTMLRFAELFEDIPKGSLLLHVEQDDIFEVRKRLPNVALCGGMPIDLLGHGTPEQCVDYAKKLIDELGGGFFLSQDKMLSFRKDATRENLLAVNEYVRNNS